jgi:hypothetical protein
MGLEKKASSVGAEKASYDDDDDIENRQHYYSLIPPETQHPESSPGNFYLPERGVST